MTARRFAAVAVAGALAAATAACGFGPGEQTEGEAALTVTRDYGSHELLSATQEDPPASETVLRFLDREADVATRYGGGFVQGIEGIEGTTSGGRRLDWFFYVNGIESSVGAADVEVDGGDRIWWDYRDWTNVMRVPAVVGSWPEPFVEGGAGEPATVECLAADDRPCEDTLAALRDAGAEAELAEGRGGDHRSGPSVLVGPWEELRDDPDARLLELGQGRSQVFAEIVRGAGGYELSLLDPAASEAERLADAGLIAALRSGEDPPVWVVTGTDAEGLTAAVELLESGDELANRYAVAVAGERVLPVPVVEGGGE